MMDSIYDRLGDLLKETLDAGEVKFVKVDIPAPEEKKSDERKEKESENPGRRAFENPEDFILRHEKESREYHGSGGSGRIYHSSEAGSFTQREYKPKSFVYKKLTPEVENAYKILDVPVSFGIEDIKKAYKNKLKAFHPDLYENDSDAKKEATDKTRMIVEAYKVISNFLEI